MSEQDTTSPGQALYELFRSYADKQPCATYSWCGMTDGYRSAWQHFAERLLNKNKNKTTDKAD